MTSGAFEQTMPLPPRQSTRSKWIWAIGVSLFVAVNVTVILSTFGGEQEPEPVRLVDADGRSVEVPGTITAPGDVSSAPTSGESIVMNERSTPSAGSANWHPTWWLGGVVVCIGVVAISVSAARRRAFEADPLGETLLLAGRKLGLARGEVKAIERLAGEPGRALGLIVSTPALTQAIAERGAVVTSSSDTRALRKACEKLGVDSLAGRMP
ncbi:MAG: hypothetical protein AB7V21_12755 [Phycisphaerales bacterium]